MNEQNISKILKRLLITLSKKKFSSFELGNLEHDLAAVEARLEAGHYAHSDFIARNTYDIPRRTEEFLVYLQGYHEIAQIWAKVLKPIITENTKCVLDLCPGWAPKIELALHNLAFSGTVQMWDVDLSSTKRAMDYMKLFKPNYDLQQVGTNLLSGDSQIKSDLIVANHIIDDLLLYKFCMRNKIELSSLYGSESLLIAATEGIITDKKIQKEISSRLVSVVDTTLSKGGFFVISQYAGLFEKANHLDNWILFCKEILDDIKTELFKKSYHDQSNVIYNSLQNSEEKYFFGEDIFCVMKT